MRFILLLFLTINVVEAGLLDFLNIKQANIAYENKNYQLATEKFANINNDTARLNQANSLYKQGLYKQALEKYQDIKQKDLNFDRLYNSGNAYAKLKKINEAIDSYKMALKLKQDADAQFNLKLLKEQKTKRKNNQQAKKNKNKDKKQKKNTHQKKQKQASSKKSSDKEKSEDKQQQIKKLNAIKQQRWEKSLNRKLRTLLIPLNKQQDNNEKNPW